MNPTGIARTELSITDLSVIVNSGLKGIHGWTGVTERGPIGKPILVGSWLEYTRYFGGLLDGNDFPLLCKRALEAGAKLKINRAVHYTDVEDKTSYDAVTASVTLGTTVVFKANNAGKWGNGLTLQIVAAMNGIANEFDIVVKLAGKPELDQTVTNVKKLVDASTIADFNARCALAVIAETSTGNLVATANAVLATGADGVEPTTIDYIGDSAAENGIHAFDNDVDITKIAVPAKAIPEIDIALAAYADERGDIIALLRTPVGITGLVAVDYREGTGLYSHTPVNTWRAMMFTGGLKVTHPTTGANSNISELGDVTALFTKKDNAQGEWFSFSGRDRGSIKNALGVVYNLGSSARRAEADLVDARGINVVIQHPSFGIVSWGNSTLYKSNTLLKKAEVAELMIFISRSLRPLVEVELFNPNDVITWKNIFRRVSVFMDYLKAERAIWDYEFQGDQDIDKIEDAVVNTPQGVDSGLYVFNLFVAPKVAMKYVGIRVAVTNSGVKFDTLAENL